jgi:hypothetical protein
MNDECMCAVGNSVLNKHKSYFILIWIYQSVIPSIIPFRKFHHSLPRTSHSVDKEAPSRTRRMPQFLEIVFASGEQLLVAWHRVSWEKACGVDFDGRKGD